MRFKGNSKQIGYLFQSFIVMYGADARIIDIQNSIYVVRGR